MVPNLWTIVCSIGCDGKIELRAIKSKNENAGTLFYIWLAVFTWGVHRSDMEPLGAVVLKIFAYLGENSLISIVNVHSCFDLDRVQTDILVYVG